MAPSIKSDPEQYVRDMTSLAHASNMDAVGAMADLWVQGHIHKSFDYRIRNCRVVCNPHGYMGRAGERKNASFSACFTVEID